MIAERPAATPWHLDDRQAALGILAAGTLLRVWQFGCDRSLWLDEALLALNIVGRSFAGLALPLDGHQAAPVGFLVVERLAVLLLGPGEHALRAFPLIAGLLALPLMYRVAWRVLDRMRLLALALFAFSERLVYYATELKQYSSDVLVALLLLSVSVPCLREDARARAYWILAAVGVVALPLSHPAVFMVAGIGLTLGLQAAVARRGRRLAWAVGLTLLWALVFVLLYVAVLRRAGADPVLADFWRGGFMPTRPGGALAWIAELIAALLVKPGGLPLLVVSVPLLAAGTISLFARRWPLGLLLTAPFAAALGASALHAYPLRGQLLLFLVPALYLLVAEGAGQVVRAVSRVGVRWSAVATAALTLALLALPLAHAARRVVHPDRGEHITPVLEYVSRRRAGEPIYVYYNAVPAFRFYAGRYGLAGPVVEGTKHRYDAERYRTELDELRREGRAWIVFAHNCDWCPVDEERYFLQHLDRIGRRQDQVLAPGASAYLYAF